MSDTFVQTGMEPIETIGRAYELLLTDPNINNGFSGDSGKYFVTQEYVGNGIEQESTGVIMGWRNVHYPNGQQGPSPVYLIDRSDPESLSDTVPVRFDFESGRPAIDRNALEQYSPGQIERMARTARMVMIAYDADRNSTATEQSVPLEPVPELSGPHTRGLRRLAALLPNVLF